MILMPPKTDTTVWQLLRLLDDYYPRLRSSVRRHSRLALRERPATVLIALVMSLLLSFVPALHTAAALDTPDDILRTLRERQASARQALMDLPDHPEAHTDTVMAALDAFWRRQAETRFQALYAQFQRYLQQQELDAGVWDVFKAEYTSILDGGERLSHLIIPFAERVHAGFRTLEEETLKALDAHFHAEGDKALQAAMDAIQKQYDALVATHFRAWPLLRWLPPVTMPSQERNVEGIPIQPGSHITGQIGIFLGVSGLMGRQLIGKLEKKMAEKAVGEMTEEMAKQVAKKATIKAIGTAVSVLGWILLAYDAVDTLQARTRLQDSLRQEMIQAYQANMNGQTLWRSSTEEGTAPLRTQVQARVHTRLAQHLAAVHRNAERLVSAGAALDAPDLREFLETTRQDVKGGKDIEHTIQILSALVQIFGERLVVRHSVHVMHRMRALAPNENDLAWLASTLGDQLFTYYAQDGVPFLEAASRIGPPIFFEVLADPSISWRQVYDTVTVLLPSDAPSKAVRGAVTCVRLGLDCRGLPLDELSMVAEQASLLTQLTQTGLEGPRALRIAVESSLRPAATGFLADDAELLAVIGPQLTEPELASYRDAKSRRALVQVFNYKVRNGTWSREQFGYSVKYVRDELEAIARDYGVNGLILYETYAGPDAGETQRQQAQLAIRLLDRGFTPDDLRTPALLSLAGLVAFLPGGGWLFAALAPIVRVTPMLGWIVAGAILLLPLILLCVLLRPLARRRRG
jgi:hypothetical protein